MCLPHRCVATIAALTKENTALLWLRAFASAGMCLPSCCLAINCSGFHASCHTAFKIYSYTDPCFKIIFIQAKNEEENKVMVWVKEYKE
jgi:hypothetical protein